MRHSAEIDKIASAIAAVQQTVPTLEKRAEVKAGQYSWKYVTHEEVWEKALPACQTAGISVSQHGDEGTGGTQWLVTMLVHTSGQWMSGKIRVESAKAGMQGLGASWSYARRIGLLGALGIVPIGEDTDGGGASGGLTGRAAKPPRVTPAARPAETTPDALAIIEQALAELPRLSTRAQVKELGKTLEGNVPREHDARVRQAFKNALARIDAAMREPGSDG